MQKKELLSQTGDLVSLVIELRQKMKVANLTAIPESFQTGTIPFDQEKLFLKPEIDKIVEVKYHDI